MPNIIYKVMSGTYSKFYNHYVCHDKRLINQDADNTKIPLQHKKYASEMFFMFYG